MNPTGIIPFGSTDSSIILQNPLTSAAEITGETQATGTLTGTGQVFDPVLGVKCGAPGGLKFTGITNYRDLEKGGQISFEGESDFFAFYETPNAVAGSNGYIHVTNDHFISWAATDNGVPFGRYYVATTSKLRGYINSVDTQLDIPLTNLGSPRFKRITFSWIGDLMEVYVSGGMVKPMAFTPGAVDLFKNLYIGSLRGSTSAVTNGNLDYYFRNLVVSTQPVMRITHPMLTACSWGGDSFAVKALSSGEVISEFSAYDQAPIFVLKGKLLERGITGNFINRGLTASVVNKVTAGFEWLTSTEGVAFLADISPVKILQIGTNDAGLSYFSTFDFDADYKALINTVMATTSYLVVGNIPTIKTGLNLDTAEYRGNTATVNTTIDGISDWWDANNPTRKGAIRVYNLFKATGGENPDMDMFNGSWIGSPNVHLSSRGRLIQGELTAQTLYPFLGKI